jgi:Hemerythrin HHE cation binding domain
MLDALSSDHQAITEQLADSANALHTDAAMGRREQLVIDMVGHFVAEEQYLYPTVRDELSDGTALADNGFTADRAIERQLKELEDPDLAADQLVAIWTAIQAEFAAHVARQHQLFIDLATVVSAARLAELGDGIAGAEQLAPTRPRTLALESPGANKFISFVEGYVDHVRDYYAKRGVEPSEQ